MVTGFMLRGIWRAGSSDWPEAYAIPTIEANADISPYHDRQMAVLTRDQRMDWLDAVVSEEEILRPLPAGTFHVKPLSNASSSLGWQSKGRAAVGASFRHAFF
jgi:putative SOS response-associated peptidase YedK